MRVELIWAAAGLGRYIHHFTFLTTVYVVKGYGHDWAAIFVAIGSVLTGLGIIGVILGAVSAKRSLRDAETTRHASLFIEMAHQFDGEELRHVRWSLRGLTPEQFSEYFFEAYDANDPEFYRLLTLGNFFEYFAVLEEMDGLKFDLIEKSIGNSVVTYWDMWRLAVEADTDEWPGLYEHWQTLAQRIRATRAEEATPAP